MGFPMKSGWVPLKKADKKVENFYVSWFSPIWPNYLGKLL